MSLAEFVRSRPQALAAATLAPAIDVVAGNESADLDSIVCALVYAYLLQQQDPRAIVLPYINLRSEDVSLRSETLYLMGRLHIPLEGVALQDTLDVASLHAAGRLRLHLVDHNEPTQALAAVADSVVEVIDHHVVSPTARLPARSVIEMVGSCSTLVTLEVLRVRPVLLTREIATLLLAAILVGTLPGAPLPYSWHGAARRREKER